MTGIQDQRQEEKAPEVEYRAYYADPDLDWKPSNEPISPTFDYKKRIGDLCYVMGKRRLPPYFRVTRRNARRQIVGKIAGAVAWMWPYVLFGALLNFPQLMEMCAILGGIGLAIDRLARWHQRRERPWI